MPLSLSTQAVKPSLSLRLVTAGSREKEGSVRPLVEEGPEVKGFPELLAQWGQTC